MSCEANITGNGGNAEESKSEGAKGERPVVETSDNIMEGEKKIEDTLFSPLIDFNDETGAQFG